MNRREALLTTLFGAGYVGLRALATGLPASILLNPSRALADTSMTCAPEKAQYIILNTSGSGDPINANVPGMYEDPMIAHPMDAQMTPTPLSIGGKTYTAAKPWSMLPQSVLDRTCFWHLMTNTPVHPKEPDVLQLMGAIKSAEMFPSLLAKTLAPCLSTIQSQPITIGATTPSEGLRYEGAVLPIIPPLSLKATLSNVAGPLTNLQPLRDQTLGKLNDLYRNNGATRSQRAFLDSLVSSQEKVRGIRQDLLASLDAITDNGIDSQITAALALIQMNVTPVVAIHIPFGGDNHHDTALATESAQTVSGVAAIASLMSQLSATNLSDRVTFMSLNVFGRTLGMSSANGRQHNQNHQVSITIGKSIQGGVVGGVGPVMTDYGALAIDSATGAGGANGDIAPIDSLASFGKTTLAAVGVDATAIETAIPKGKTIASALV